MITGYGTIEGNLVYVYSQDSTVLNGSIGEMHAKKIVKLYDFAMKMGVPVIGFVDCVGIRLQEATDALNGFGEIYMSQINASGVVPQITAIFGNCGGGMAVVPELADFTFMETKKAKLFVNSPNTLESNYTEKCNTASAKFQSEEVGSVDVVGSEDEIIEQIRKLVSILPSNNEDDMSYDECTDDLNRVCDNLNSLKGDTACVLSEISDDRFFFEVRQNYAKDMVTGFIRLNGMTVGAVANRTEIYDKNGKVSEKFDGVLTSEGCEKAKEFVDFCDAFNIPILTLTDVNGYKATVGEEKKIGKATGKLTYAFANATVAKVNVIIGKAMGSAYLTMNSKSIGADIVYAWKDATIGMMDSKAAAKVMYSNKIKGPKAQEILNEKAAAYDAVWTAKAAANHGYIDDIIDFAETRKRLIAAFEMLFTKRDERPSKKHGTV